MTDPNEPNDYDSYIDYVSGNAPGLDGKTFVDGETAEPMVWLIRFKDEIRVHMATSPPAHIAATEAERDWWLKTSTRPLDELVVEQVPGPYERAAQEEADRWENAKTELRAETRRKFLENQQKGQTP